LPRLAGHEAGTETVRRVMGYCRDAGIRYLTLYAFSTENWSRPPEEVAGLMTLLGTFIQKHEAELHEKQVRLRVIGNRADISAPLMAEIERIERETAHFERQVIIALSYSGRNELVRAVRKIIGGGLAPEAIDEGVIAAHLDAPDVPDPDLIIRTSGEMRVSNLLLWQCAYSEFVVTPVLWPDFGEKEFAEALEAFAKRSRRFGGVG
jgi:undecaprenyl diphosphate synthase